jgi:hypothetical protein
MTTLVLIYAAGRIANLEEFILYNNNKKFPNYYCCPCNPDAFLKRWEVVPDGKRVHRAKECLLSESEEIIIEFTIIAETNIIKMRFLKSDLY